MTVGSQKTEVITVRGLPLGTRKALAHVAELSGRSLEAEARHTIKGHLASALGSTCLLQQNEGMPDPKVVTSEQFLANAVAKRDSAKRKLDAGSAAIAQEDLERMENEVITARLKLGEVSSQHPDALLHALM